MKYFFRVFLVFRNLRPIATFYFLGNSQIDIPIAIITRAILVPARFQTAIPRSIRSEG